MKPPFMRGSKADADLFRSRLEQIINMRHELVRLVVSSGATWWTWWVRWSMAVDRPIIAEPACAPSREC